MEDNLRTGNMEKEVQKVDSHTEPVFSDDLIGQVFMDWKIWKMLGRMLNFSDLKACREVCKPFNQMVLDETNFKSRALVTLTPKTMKPEVFGTSEIMFKNFDLNISPTDLSKYEVNGVNSRDSEETRVLEVLAERTNPFCWLYPKLGHAEYLCLRLMPTREGIEDLVEKHPRHIFGATQEFAVAAKKNLKYFGIELIFLGSDWHKLLLKKEDVPDHPALKDVSLDCLEILDSGWRGLTRPRVDDITVDKVPSVFVGVRSFKIPAGLLKEDGYYNKYGLLERSSLSSFTHIVQGVNESEIQQIYSYRLEGYTWREDYDMLETSSAGFFPLALYPNLREINTTELSGYVRELCEFLNRHPELEDISVSVLGPLPADLVRTIELKSSKLRKLCLKASSFDSALDNPSSWNFLNCTELRYFHLEIIDHSRSWTEPRPWQRVEVTQGMDFTREALKSLPATVEKIFIGGIPHWTLEPKLGADDFAGICPKTLTELTLSNCGGCVDDGTVDYICKNFKMLQKLDLRGAVKCTDHGFTGTSSVDTSSASFCLSDLKGMKKLILRACTGITDVTLKEGIKFLELNFLDLVGVDKLTAAGIQVDLAQNPSLETLLTSDATILEKKTELIAKHPWLKYIASS